MLICQHTNDPVPAELRATGAPVGPNTLKRLPYISVSNAGRKTYSTVTNNR
jgi:hypothetical protein